MRVPFSILVALFLTSCASQEQIAQRNAAAQAANIAQDDAYCGSIGAPPGSPNHTQCRLSMLQRRDQLAAAETARQMEASRALIAAGAALSAQPAPDFLPPQTIARETRCRSTAVIGAVQTVCQ
jgi:hypothetical protein